MNGQVHTFGSDEEVIAELQSRYGTAFWSQYQVIRQPFWSRQAYPAAGVTEMTFFTETAGQNGLTLQDTNMQTGGQFQGGNHFFCKTVGVYFEADDYDILGFDGTDASTVDSDLKLGFGDAGVMTLTINGYDYLTQPSPFRTMPVAVGPIEARNRGLNSAVVSAAPWSGLNTRRKGLMPLRPFLIESGQTFTFKIGFPTGLVPVIATNIEDSSTNPFYIGIAMDGLLFRPVSA